MKTIRPLLHIILFVCSTMLPVLGHGFAKIVVASGGVISIGATLANGTTAKQSVPLGGGGVIPLFQSAP